MISSLRISKVSLAVLYALSISNVYVSAVCTIPNGYKSFSWFQLYLDPPSPTTTWIYGVYDSDRIVTNRNDNETTFNLKYSCVSSYEENGLFYYIYSQAMFGESYCAKAKLTSDGNAIFVSEIQTDFSAADAKTCPAMFTESCFGATGQVAICSAVWRPKSPPTLPPQFTLAQSPFQGAYQLTVNGTQCAGNPQSTVTVQGSTIQFKACSGSSTTYKNRTIFQESLTVLGALDGQVLTAGENSTGMKVLLLVSSDNVTLYCAKYVVLPDMSINMTIDVSSDRFGSCALPAASSTENRFVSLMMTSTPSSTLPNTGTSVAASGATSQVTGQSARVTGTNASSGTNAPVQTGTAVIGTGGTAGTRAASSVASSAPVSGAGTTVGMTTRGMSSGAQTTQPVTTVATTAARTSAAVTAVTTIANSAVSAAASASVAAVSTVSQAAGVSTVQSSVSLSTSKASIGPNSQASVSLPSSAAISMPATPGTTGTSGTPQTSTSSTTTPSTPSACLGFTCSSPFQCNVNQGGVPSCGCPPGTTLSNTTGQCTSSSGKDSGAPVWAIAVGVIGAMIAAAAVGFIVMCCMRSAWMARQGPMAYGLPPQHFHRHYPEQLSPSYFNDKYPIHEVNVQPVTFPSRGSVYGGTLGMGFGGYSGQTKVCNHYPVMGNNSYVMIKSSIPPD